MKRNSKFSVTHKDKSMAELVRNAGPKTLAVWANDCVKRVMPYYEGRYPEDHRPRRALETLQAWINTGVFRMEVIRKTALASHAAACDVGEDNAARSAARAAGQAVATAHVPTHSVAAANYALQAVYRATGLSGSDAALAKERAWQLAHLRKLLTKRK